MKLCVVEVVLFVEFCHGKLPVLVTLADLDVRLDWCPIEHCFNQGSQELVGRRSGGVTSLRIVTQLPGQASRE